jgi:hypothetical protein
MEKPNDGVLVQLTLGLLESVQKMPVQAYGCDGQPEPEKLAVP